MVVSTAFCMRRMLAYLWGNCFRPTLAFIIVGVVLISQASAPATTTTTATATELCGTPPERRRSSLLVLLEEETHFLMCVFCRRVFQWTHREKCKMKTKRRHGWRKEQTHRRHWPAQAHQEIGQKFRENFIKYHGQPNYNLKYYFWNDKYFGGILKLLGTSLGLPSYKKHAKSFGWRGEGARNNFELNNNKWRRQRKDIIIINCEILTMWVAEERNNKSEEHGKGHDADIAEKERRRAFLQFSRFFRIHQTATRTTSFSGAE